MSSGTAVETPTVNSPTKEEVKAENSLLKEDAVEYNRKICELELKNESAARNSKRMKLQVLSLSDSLKAEKKKSRAAIKQLLTLSATQHNVLSPHFRIRSVIFSQNMISLFISCNITLTGKYMTIKGLLIA